jgi:hypothetical protein
LGGTEVCCEVFEDTFYLEVHRQSSHGNYEAVPKRIKVDPRVSKGDEVSDAHDGAALSHDLDDSLPALVKLKNAILVPGWVWLPSAVSVRGMIQRSTHVAIATRVHLSVRGGGNWSQVNRLVKFQIHFQPP